MRAVVFDGKKAAIRDLEIPVPGTNESLIKITLAAVCSTDKEILRGYKPDFTGVMGHEFTGIVEQSDDISLIGQRIVGELNAGCGGCVYCKTDREKHCLDRKVIGLTGKDGCFAEFMTLRTNLLHKIPDNLPDRSAIFCEPLAAALEIPDMLHIKPSSPVCVVGDGRLGFMIAQVLSLTGAEVAVSGRHADKLTAFEPFARTELHEGETFEIVVDAAGGPSGIESARKLVRKRGTVVLKSTYAGNADINLSGFVVDEVTIMGSRCGPFEPALRLLERGLVSLPPIELYHLDDWQAAFNSTAFKAGFKFGGDNI